MEEAFTLKLSDHLNDPAKKRCFNERVFSLIASEYDFITGALSFCRDAAWKRMMMRLLPDHDVRCCLDLACGTGQITSLLARKYPRGKVIGVDLTDNMLRIAKRHIGPPNVHYIRLDMCELGFKDDSIDVVTGGYALRNAPDLQKALQEIRRVLKPGGTAAFLDFSKSPAFLSQTISYWILKVWGSFWGGLLHGKPQVYTYIAESLSRFPDRLKLHSMLGDNDMHVVESKLFFFGMIELLAVRRA